MSEKEDYGMYVVEVMIKFRGKGKDEVNRIAGVLKGAVDMSEADDDAKTLYKDFIDAAWYLTSEQNGWTTDEPSPRVKAVLDSF